MLDKQRLNKIFKAISDPIRRDIFHIVVLASSTMTITEIAENFDISRQGVTKHIKVLADAELINVATHGREKICIAEIETLKLIKDWLGFYDKFWNDSLQKLDNFLDQMD